MRRHDQPVELLVRLVRQRKDHPGRVGVRSARAHLDAADDAVRARRRRDLDGVAGIPAEFQRRRQVQRDHVGRHGNGFGRRGRPNGEDRERHHERREQAAGDGQGGEVLGYAGRRIIERHTMWHRASVNKTCQPIPKVFKTQVPRSIRLAEAPSFGQPVILYDIRSKGAEAYLQLARELLSQGQLALFSR